jgi:hypothetical protein
MLADAFEPPMSVDPRYGPVVLLACSSLRPTSFFSMMRKDAWRMSC